MRSSFPGIGGRPLRNVVCVEKNISANKNDQREDLGPRTKISTPNPCAVPLRKKPNRQEDDQSKYPSFA